MKKLIVFNRGPSKKTFTILLCILTIFVITGKAQSLKRQCISSLGSSTLSNSVLIQQTIGQPYLTNTFYSGSLSFRPGFQQPSTLSTLQTSPSDQSLKVYPNPASNSFSLEAPDFSNGIIRITDLNGRLMMENKIPDQAATVNCQSLQNGLYILTLYNKNNVLVSSKLVINK